MSFRDNWDRLVNIEQGYVDDPDDSGGATRWGVTELVARRHGYRGRMRHLPLDTAMTISKLEYWDPMRLDEIDALAPPVASEMFEFGYHAGPNRAALHLQRCLNALNRRRKDYDDIVVDGAVGGRTLMALRGLEKARGREGLEVLYRLLDSLQGAYYVELVERREKDERFLYGWARHRLRR